MISKKIFALLCLMFLVSGCNEYEKLIAPALKAKLADTNLNPVFDGEAEPPIPNESANNKTVLGIDSNNNGIRDDVDIWINRTGLDYNERMAMRQNASAEQKRLKVCEQRIVDEISRAETASFTSWECLHATSDPRHHENYTRNSLRSIIYNISTRRDCNKYFNSLTYSYGGGEGAWHKSCNFKIENEDKLIEEYHHFWRFTK